MKSTIYSWKKQILDNLWLSVTILIVLFYILSVFIFYHFEYEHENNLTIIESFRIVLVNFLGEPYDAKTNIGKLILLLLFILGIFVIAILIAKMTAIFVGMNIGPQIPKNIKNHIVICNWHNNAESIITELHSKQAEPNLNIVIITDSNIDEIKRRYKYDKHVFVIDSDPTNYEVLLTKTRSHHAKSVIILIDPEHSDSDAKAVLISLAITKSNLISHQPRIIAEVVNPNKAKHLLDAGVDEWISSTGFGLGIIAQTALYGKLSDVYQQLLGYSSHNNEIYLIDNSKYPQWFVGKNFAEIAAILIQKRKDKHPVILIGIKRADKVILNPKQNDFDQLTPEDSLIVMAFKLPTLRTNYVK